jgi:hypothetical protein
MQFTVLSSLAAVIKKDSARPMSGLPVNTLKRLSQAQPANCKSSRATQPAHHTLGTVVLLCCNYGSQQLALQ